MTIEDDMDGVIKWSERQSNGKAEYARSVTAYVEIRRFDRAKDAILSGDHLDFFGDTRTFPTIVGIVTDYRNGAISSDEAVRYLNIAQKRAERHLRSKGYNPDPIYDQLRRNGKGLQK